MLDDGSKLDVTVIRKPINLADFSYKRINALNKKKIKDKVIRSVYPKSEICSLMAEEKLTKSEKIVDTAIWLCTPFTQEEFDKKINELF